MCGCRFPRALPWAGMDAGLWPSVNSGTPPEPERFRWRGGERSCDALVAEGGGGRLAARIGRTQWCGLRPRDEASRSLSCDEGVAATKGAAPMFSKCIVPAERKPTGCILWHRHPACGSRGRPTRVVPIGGQDARRTHHRDGCAKGASCFACRPLSHGILPYAPTCRHARQRSIQQPSLHFDARLPLAKLMPRKIPLPSR